MYEFQLGKGLNDLESKRYVLPTVLEDPFGDLEPANDTIYTTRGVCPMAEGIYASVMRLE
jgi:hypothetical protein